MENFNALALLYRTKSAIFISNRLYTLLTKKAFLMIRPIPPGEFPPFLELPEPAISETPPSVESSSSPTQPPNTPQKRED